MCVVKHKREQSVITIPQCSATSNGLLWRKKEKKKTSWGRSGSFI